MTAAMLATPYVAVPVPGTGPAADLAAFLPVLNRLRFLAQACRADAHLDLGTACASIHACKETSLDAVARSLVQVVHEAIEGRVTFLAPGAKAMSFDEEWLLRVLDRAASRDTVSVEFLLRRRVARRNHHAFRAIIRAVAALIRE